jgi:hypothetical protein
MSDAPLVAGGQGRSDAELVARLEAQDRALSLALRRVRSMLAEVRRRIGPKP